MGGIVKIMVYNGETVKIMVYNGEILFAKIYEMITNFAGNSDGPSLDHEVTRREVERVSGEFWLYIRSELDKLKEKASDSETVRKINKVIGNSIDYQK